VIHTRLAGLGLFAASVLLGGCGGDGTGPAPVASILVAPDTAYVRLGASRQLTASPRTAAGTPVPNAHLVWASADTTIASVSPSGLVTTAGYGTTWITVAADGVVGRAYVLVTGTPGVSIVAGGGVTDTANALLAQPLVVEVRDELGVPIRGARVGLGVSTAPAAGCIPPSGEVCRNPQIALSPIGESVTDADGRMAYRVQFGQLAGTVTIVAFTPTLGAADSTRYTIEPGAASRVTLLPKDTAVFIGGRVTVRPTVTDRNGNVRGDTVQLRVASPAAALEGTSVRGVSFGRATLLAVLGTKVDSAYVSVVPHGTIAAYAPISSTGQAVALYTMNLDESDFREIRQTVVGAGYFGDMPVAWLGATKLIYHDNNWNHTKQLYVHDLTTGIARRFLASGDQMEMENFPRVSRDGAWVYFGGGAYSSYLLYRARPDGTGLERVSPVTGASIQWAPAPAPDGAQVAYVNQGTFYVGQLEVIDVATRRARTLGAAGTMPRWSPDGAQIAFIAQAGPYATSSGDLSVMRPDGSATRVVPTSTSKYVGGIDWSPDGKYLVASTDTGRLAVVEVATGTEVLLPVPSNGRALSSPAWRP
jgi:hypothetical protein